MAVSFTDSVDKIVSRYISSVASEKITYNGKIYEVKPLHVSTGIFIKRMTCVTRCGACCQKFTLDWLPSEVKSIPEQEAKFVSPRKIIINDRESIVYSDKQEDHDGYFCRNLDMVMATCGIHGFHPFSCDFETLRFKQGEDRNWFGHMPFGRSWQMPRTDGGRGVLCEWREESCTEEWKQEVIRKLLRLKDWADHFQIQTVIPNIIEWVRTGPHNRKLVLNDNKKRKGFGL